jgi:uncharacterized protein YndB with AHSA1/START domain
MYEIHVVTTIAAPPQKVFDAISDHEHFLGRPGMICHLVKEGVQNKNGRGAVREVATQGRIFTEEITAFDPPRHFEYVVRRMVDRHGKSARFLHDRGWLDFAPSGPATRVDWHSRFEIPIPILGWFLERVLGKRAATGFRQLLEQAKSELEGQTTSGNTEP